MTRFGKVEFDAWYKTYDPDFIDLSIKSNIRNSWLTFQNVMSGEHKDSIIKPINRYVEKLYPMPKLISINVDEIVLQQQNHAEFYLNVEDDGSFYNVDKPHMRQYYQSAEQKDQIENCFDSLYKFYIPWVIDEDVEVSIEQAQDSPFFVYPQKHKFVKINKDINYLHPGFVSFRFKKVGAHMTKDGTYGKILIGSPMFNIRIKADKELIKKIGNIYNV